MPTKKPLDKTKLDQIVLDARRSQAEREKGYREKALKMYPWICGRCAREFDHSNVRELTVHHRDHNHDNNPADGSNWELLCLYCHDNEHARYEHAHYNTGSAKDSGKAATFNPFANLESLLKGKQ